MKYFLLPVFGMLLMTFLFSTHAQQGIKIELSAEKTTFLLGEPVVVLVKVTNTANSPLMIPVGLEAECDMLHYEITNPDGKTTPYSPMYVVDTDKRIILNKNESAYGAARLFYGGNGYTFTKPGTYKVQARFKDVQSNALAVKISAPQNDAEREQAALILDNAEVGLFLMLEGGDELMEAHKALATLEEKYPQSLLTAYVKFAQGKNLSVPARNFVSKKPRDANLTKAIEILQSVKDAPLQMYYRVKAATTLSTCYQKTGRKEDARKTLEGMQKLLTNQKRLAPYFSRALKVGFQQLK